jgi:hypothetical protein
MTPLEQAIRSRDEAMLHINAERAYIAARRRQLQSARQTAGIMVVLSVLAPGIVLGLMSLLKLLLILAVFAS